MKKIPFTKMAGAGNDFIIIEAPKGGSLKSLARKMCHRTDGIGADGLLVIAPSKKADYRMRIFNADGSEAEMCGNGARCMAVFIADKKKERRAQFSMQTMAGTIYVRPNGKKATVTLSDPQDYRSNVALTINGRKLNVSYIDTGVPHAVVFVDELKKIDVNTIGRLIRIHKKFKPRGANANFVEQIKPQEVALRTYERGVEAETRACGTGSVAAALVTYLKSRRVKNPSKQQASVRVRTASGETLTVSFQCRDEQLSNVRLTGQTKYICEGEYYFLKS